jgi:hypothetical protein
MALGSTLRIPVRTRSDFLPLLCGKVIDPEGKEPQGL